MSTIHSEDTYVLIWNIGLSTFRDLYNITQDKDSLKLFTQNIILESIMKTYLVFVWPTPLPTNRMKMRFRDTYFSTNLYQEWEERLMTPIRSSKKYTSHTWKVGEMGHFLLFWWHDKPKTDVIPRSEKVMHIQFEWIFVRFMVPLFKE